MQSFTFEATITADGHLKLDQPLQLPPGRYQVTLTPISRDPDVSDPPRDRREEFWSGLRELRAKYLGDRPPRLAEDIMSDFEAQRQEWAERDAKIERLQRESYIRRHGKGTGDSSRQPAD